MTKGPLGRSELLDDDQLGDALAAAVDKTWPPTPTLADEVAARLLTQERQTGRARPRLAAGPLAAAAVLAVLLVGPLFFSPALRQAAADFFGVDGVRIEVVEESPTPSRSGPSASPPSFGRAVTLSAAQAEVSFEIKVPEVLGAPDDIYLDVSSGNSVVSLVYEARPGLPETAETGVGLLVMEFEGRVIEDFMKKVAGPGTSLKVVELEGGSAFWISGAPHPIAYLGSDGELRESPERLAANTLLFSRGGITYRVEGDLTLSRALEIGRSLLD